MNGETVVLLVWGAVLLGFGAYWKNVQGTTLALGRAIGASGSATGLQDAITPRWQTRNTFILFAVFVLFAIQAFVALPWYWAIAAIAAAFFIGIPLVSRTLVPREMSPPLISKLKQDLAKRKSEFERNGDSLRASVADEVLSKITAYQQGARD
jgi:hypothetical protein